MSRQWTRVVMTVAAVATAMGCGPSLTPTLAQYPPHGVSLIFQKDLATIQLGETEQMTWDSWEGGYDNSVAERDCHVLNSRITLSVNGEYATVVSRGGPRPIELCGTVASAGPARQERCKEYSYCERPLFRPAQPLSPDTAVAELILTDGETTMFASVDWPAAKMTAVLRLPNGVSAPSDSPGEMSPAPVVHFGDEAEVSFAPALSCPTSVGFSSGGFWPETAVLTPDETLKTTLRPQVAGWSASNPAFPKPPPSPWVMMLARNRCVTRCEGLSKCRWGGLDPAARDPALGVQKVEFTLSFEP